MQETFRTDEAARVVAQVQRRLPPGVREVAMALPVVMHDWPSEAIIGTEFPSDILGLFVGAPHGMVQEGEGVLAPHILIFVESIWDFVESDLDAFRQEVKITYLHELGHYLGWDEDEVAARGLD